LYINDGGSFTEAADPNNILFDEDEEAVQNLRYLNLTSTGPGLEPVIALSNNFTFGVQTLATNVPGLAGAVNGVTQAQGAIDDVTQVRDIALGELDGNLDNGPEYVLARQDDGAGSALEGTLPISIGNVNTRGVNPANASALADSCATVSLADFDNDGDIDIFGGCASSDNGQTSNIVLLNDGSGAFNEIVEVPGMPTTAFVSLVADFNGDGWTDVYVGGGIDDEAGEDFILLNNGGPANNYLQVDLVGSNDDAIGAQVFVGGDDWQVRENGHTLHRGQDSRTLHFGLGEADAVAPLEIRWPDGTFETCEVAGINQRVEIEQGSAACSASDLAGLEAAIAADPVIEETPEEEPEEEPEPTEPVFCNDLEVTINLQLDPGAVATNSHDVILGTEGDDVINGLDGRDTICGLGGNDLINGGQGRDYIEGGAGDDIIEAGQGADIVLAGAGDDRVNGGRGDDIISGGAGNDDLRGQDGIDIVNGQNGDDRLSGGNKADRLLGGNGNDTLSGQTRADFLDGGAGADTFNGGGGTDTCIVDATDGPNATQNCELP